MDIGDGGDRRRDKGAPTAEAAMPRLPPSAAGGDDGGAMDRGDDRAGRHGQRRGDRSGSSRCRKQ